MSDIDKQIAAIELLLETTDADDPTRAVLEARLAKLRGLPGTATPGSVATPSTQPGRPGGVRLDHTQVERLEDIVGGDKLERGDKVQGNKYVYNGPHGDDPASLVRRYLAGVIRDTQRLTFIDADSADAEQEGLFLHQVYIRLEVATAVDKDGKPLDRARRADQAPPEPARQMTALEALQYHGRLVLLGAPGSGKSTFARHLAFCLARSCCGEASGVERLEPEWQRGALTPIWVELSPLAEWLAQNDRGQSPGELLWAYLGAQHTPELAAELRRRLERDQAVLLLDGLDEIGAGEDGKLLRRMRAMIEALTATRTPGAVLLTCRVLDYAEKRRQLVGWPTETLLPFSVALQQAFIANWYRTLEREGRPLQRGADELIARLQRAVREKPDLRRLAGNPLLLTMMATLQGAKGELPDKRVELYAECLDQLLRRWRRRKDRPDLESFLGIPGWNRNDTDRLLDHLGYAAESRHPADDDETAQTGSAHLSERELIETAAGVFKHYATDPYAKAERFRTYIDQYGSNGILQQHGPGNYRFPHRTFREFLAARRLVSNRDWDEDERVLTTRLQRRATSAQWHEALLLAASLLVAQNRADSLAQLARVLLKEHRAGSRAWARNVVVAGELLAQTERRQLASFGEAQVWDDTVTALRRVIEPQGGQRSKLLLDVDDRVRAGRALGQLGDLRPGVCTLEPAWCEVPAGPFLLGSTDQDEEANHEEKPQRTVDLPSFRIARYPVTNAQWRMFKDAGGYSDRHWWSKAGWAVKEEAGWMQPNEWDNPRFNGANQPVVGISWYEATAFCRWLSAQLGCEVRLPSEAEWEKAARGTDGRVYPWGNVWDAAKANTAEGGFDTTTPVGCYLESASPYGALDMSGNVIEFTASHFLEDYHEYDGTTQEMEDGKGFVLRGGAWFDSSDTARCAYRERIASSSRNLSVGLRVCASLTLDD